ncbi:MAG: helix-turn-helix domain-containing protein [Bdellovibrionales bacterium]|nr:helix-turn-helix domain-containing protein [Bdellovibrionales bacterium]
MGEKIREEEGNKEEEIGSALDEKSTESRNVYTDEVKSKQASEPRLKKWTRDSQKFFENLTWLTSDEAAEYLRLPSVGALRVLVCRGKVPFHKLGRALRFKRVELDQLLDSSKRYGGIQYGN